MARIRADLICQGLRQSKFFFHSLNEYIDRWLKYDGQRKTPSKSAHNIILSEIPDSDEEV
jgi:hypothetical protein